MFNTVSLVPSGPVLLTSGTPVTVGAKSSSSDVDSEASSGLTEDTVTISPEGAAASAAANSPSEADASAPNSSADAPDAASDADAPDATTTSAASGPSGEDDDDGGLSAGQIAELTSMPISFTVDGIHYNGSVISDGNGFTATASGQSGSGGNQVSAETSLEMRLG